MFVIRKIYDHVLQVNRGAVRQVQGILRAQFRGVPEAIIDKIPEQLQNPLKFQYQTILFVGEDQKKNVRGFAILLNFPDLLFCYLDFMSAAPQRTGGGIGGALYERLREEALLLGSSGLFFECLPDDPRLCADPAVLKQNASRLKFYERYGARPFANTEYETPITPGSDCPPYLVFDDLGQSTAQGRGPTGRKSDPGAQVRQAVPEGICRESGGIVPGRPRRLEGAEIHEDRIFPRGATHPVGGILRGPRGQRQAHDPPRA